MDQIDATTKVQRNKLIINRFLINRESLQLKKGLISTVETRAKPKRQFVALARIFDLISLPISLSLLIVVAVKWCTCSSQQVEEEGQREVVVEVVALSAHGNLHLFSLAPSATSALFPLSPPILLSAALAFLPPSCLHQILLAILSPNHLLLPGLRLRRL